MATASSLAQPTPRSDSAAHFDMLIVGAGLSGVDIAYRLQTELPDKSYAILEARDAIGGTWDLFRYPGIRSDSDMYTLGFPFRPWSSEVAIAGGTAIRDYIADTARMFGIDRHIRFGKKVGKASWSSEQALWTLDVTDVDAGTTQQMTCRYLYMASGYYDYAAGFTPDFPGLKDFKGRVIHPQHWPEDLDYSGKRVVVIGSGATAVTLVPSMAPTAAHVTMLQRSPTYIVSRKSKDGFAAAARKILPEGLAGSAAKWKSVLYGVTTYALARKRPGVVKSVILRGVKAQLPENYEIERDFEPSYAPWDQRICLVPDGDLFKAIRKGKASIVTDHIERFTEHGIALQSGRELEADVVVTATGLVMRLLGGVALEIDGEPVNPADHLVYKGMMLSDVPNLTLAFGYTNASWTLKCDLSARYTCRLIKHMDQHGFVACAPRLDDPSITPEPMLNFTSGYVQRANQILPFQGSRAPWKVHQNYIFDLMALSRAPVTDGTMRFMKRGQRAVPVRRGGPAIIDAAQAPRPVTRPRGAVAAAATVATVGGLALFAKWTERRIERQVPPRGAFIDVNGHRIHYHERGEGPAIVMIHGLAGQMRNFSYALLDKLAKDHRVILVDRPGSGYSDAIGTAGIPAQAEHIAAFIETLGLDRPLVVGHSLGGAVALALALDFPELVGGLALVSPLTQAQEDVPAAFRGLAIPSPTARAAIAWTFATPTALMMAEGGTRAVFAPEAAPEDFGTRGGGSLVARPDNYLAAAADLFAARDDLPALVARYKDLKVPVAVLYGRDDRVLKAKLHGQQFADTVKHVDLTIIEGGHMIPVTQADTVAAWIGKQSDRIKH